MMEAKDITQEDMGQFLGLSQQYLNLLIRNKVNPRPPRLKEIITKIEVDYTFWFKSSGAAKETAIKSAMIRSGFERNQEALA